ncbi:MAG: translocation/assembly module TamB domain-containing protein, partial [Bacteroidia bacterium]
MRIFKKVLKITGWILGSITLLLIIVALLIQLPAFQNFIIHKATAYVSNKTHTKVEIARVGISFPKSVFLEGVYLEDTAKDTLVYAGRLEVNMDMIALIKGNIHIQKISLKTLTANVSRAEGDSLFNYNFLITSFSDTTKVKSPKKKSSNTFELDNVSLENIKVNFNDRYNGMLAAIDLESLNLKMNRLNLDEQLYDVDELAVTGLKGLVEINKKSISEKSDTTIVLPRLLVNSLTIEKSLVTYNDKTVSNKINATINDLELKHANLDLNKEELLLDKIKLAESKIQLNFTQVKADSDVTAENATTKNNWRVTVKEIALNNNQLNYNIINQPALKKGFDASHLNYKTLNINATDLIYSASVIKLNLKQASVTSDDGFSLSNLSTQFSMDDHRITSNNIYIKTNRSSINASVDLKFSSLASLKDSIQNLFVKAELKNTTISAADVLYFSPQLDTQPFFNHKENEVKISGNITGLVGNLKGERLEIHIGAKTLLTTDFLITGLPDGANAYFDFPNLKLQTGRNDLVKLLGKMIPQNISLPENISISSRFKGRIKEFQTVTVFASDYGSVTASGNIDRNENFKADVSLVKLNVGKFLKDTTLGPVTLTASATGKGLSKNTIAATVKVKGDALYYNNYTYHNLAINGNITSQQFEGQLNMNDSNLALDFDGLVNMEPDNEHYKFSLDLKGADLKNLNFSKDDLRIGAKAIIDLKGKDMNSISGTAGVTELILAKHGVKYRLDSVVFASLNEKRKSEVSLQSAIVGIKYSGTFAPANMMAEIKEHINQFFPVVKDSAKTKEKNENEEGEAQNFSFEIQLHNNPVLSEVLFPQLTAFDPGIISGSFDSEKNILNIKAEMNQVIYSGIELNNLNFNINSDPQKFNYSLSADNISNSQVRLENFKVDGRLQDRKAYLDIASTDADGNKKIQVHSVTEKFEDGYKVHLSPSEFFLANQQWTVAENNYIAFGEKGFLINDFDFENSSERVSIISENKKYGDNIKIEIKNFDLNNLSRIVQKDTSFIIGNLNADVLLKKVNNSYGIIANATLDSLKVKGVPVGNIAIKAENPTAEKFTLAVQLAGNGNDMNVNGTFFPKDSANGLNLKTEIKSLSLKTVEAFSMGQISETEGSIAGNLTITGSTTSPDINGDIIFKDGYFRPAALNNRLHLVNEKISISPEALSFNNFTIIDEDEHKASINGAVTMKHFSDFGFNLSINANDFLVFNTTPQPNIDYYGRMIIDCDVKIKGPMTLPVVESKIKLKNGSSFTFAVPETKLTTDRGENVVVFLDSLKFHPIIIRNEETEKKKSALTGYDITSSIEIDNKATLRLLIDPVSNDSLVVKGDAALSFSLDPSGKITLTGTYELTDGSYVVSLQSFVKRKFNIEKGSTIIWNGDPLDAEVNITAIYTVRASPVDLVANEISGLSEADKNSYRQRLPFLVYLKLTGPLLQPVIAFEISLEPQDKGALGGAVTAK